MTKAERDKIAAATKAALAKRWDEPSLKFVEGGLDVEHWACKFIAASFAKTLKDIGAKNYVTIDFVTDDGPVTVTVQYKDAQSPADVQKELKELLREALWNLPDRNETKRRIIEALKRLDDGKPSRNET